jgi:hypothetical protein
VSLIQEVKAQASGRERDIFVAVGGASPDWFTSAGKPCPHCHGDDRFSWEQSKASFFCRQCFSEGSARDVVGNVAWLLFGPSSVGNGEKQNEAAQKIADYLGIKPKKKRKPRQPETTKAWSKMRILGYVETHIKIWCDLVPPIVPSATKRCGIIHGDYQTGPKYRWNSVMIPGVVPRDLSKPFSETNCEVQHYEMQRYDRQPYDFYWEANAGDSAPKVSIKMHDSTPIGLVGPWQEIADAEYVLKCEGCTDMLAALTALPDGWVAISNTNGSKAYADWIAKLCAGKIVYVCHDHDKAGQEGALKWAKGMAQYASECFNVLLPNHGDDVRKYVHGKTGEQLVAYLTGNGKAVEAEEVKDEEIELEPTGDVAEPDDETSEERLERIGLEIVSEDSEMRVLVYSRSTRKVRNIGGIKKLDYLTLLQAGGDKVLMHLVEEAANEQPGVYSVARIKRDLAYMASKVGKRELRGRGIWPIEGEGTKVMLVNGSGSATWDGEQLKTNYEIGFGEGVCNFDGEPDWYRIEDLSPKLAEALDTRWRSTVLDDMIRYLDSWTYANPAGKGKLLAGLIGATILQEWLYARPHVLLSGQSASGKTTLIEWIASHHRTCLLDNLCCYVTDATAAGLRQEAGNRLVGLFIDEWDSHVRSKRGKAIMELLRGASSRGSAIRGQGNQTASKGQIRHLTWCSGIIGQIEEEADANRFIQIELAKYKQGNGWKKMEDDETERLSEDLKASAIVVAPRVRTLHKLLCGVSITGLDNRMTSNIAASAAFIAAMRDASFEEAKLLLISMIEEWKDGQDEEDISRPDWKTLIEMIFAIEMNLGGGRVMTVASALSGDCRTEPSVKRRLEEIGVGVKGNYKDDSGPMLFFGNIKLPETGYSARSIKQILKRIPDSEETRKTMGGSKKRVIQVPVSFVEQEFGLKVYLPSQF